jgi:hypothetical protein
MHGRLLFLPWALADCWTTGRWPRQRNDKMDADVGHNNLEKKKGKATGKRTPALRRLLVKHSSSSVFLWFFPLLFFLSLFCFSFVFFVFIFSFFCGVASLCLFTVGVQRRLLLLLLPFCCLCATSGAVRLRFDPEFSPPSLATAATRPDLYRAYNPTALSHTWRPVKVFVEDDDGVRITAGASATLSVSIRLDFAINTEPVQHPSDQAVFANLSATSNLGAWERTRQVMRRHDESIWFANGHILTVTIGNKEKQTSIKF